MATIRTAIQVYDGMSPGLKAITNALNMTISSFKALQTASSNAVDTSSIQAAREQLNKAEIAFDEVEQEIRQANQAQQQFNNDIRNGQIAANGMHGAITKIVGAIATYAGITKTLNLADQITSTKARLDLMNDGLQTTEELQNMIFASAQRSRAAYLDTAAVVSKLGILAGHAFSSNREMIFFAEQMNKQFKIGGASVQEQTAAMYQLTQAMAAGRLQGDEFRSIIENAPLLAQAIAKYMGKSVGELRELSREGLITADVIKNAMFAAADETNTKFEELPITWEQVWSSIQNRAIKVFEPVLAKISDIANNENFQKFTDGLINSLVIVANVVTDVFNVIASIGAFIYDNWSWIEPIVWGIVGAFIAYNAVALITNGIIMAQAFADKVSAASKALATGATFTYTAAQYGLNAALYACPLTWIIILIIALIALFYAAVAAINHFAGTSVSATGIIVGAFMVALAIIGNLFVGAYNLIVDIVASVWNYIASFAEFFANVFNDPIGSIIRLFAGMADTILGILQGIAKAIDAIFGSNLASAVSGWRSSLDGAVKGLVGEAKIKIPRMDSSKLYLDRFEYGKAYDTGYKWGNQIEDKFNFKNILGNAADSLNAFELGNSLDGIYKGVGDTAGNTAKMADSMDTSEEELKYLRDLAEQEVINRFTTAEIKIDMGGIVNQITKETDVDSMIAYLEEKLYETMNTAAEGVHS